MYEKIKGKMKEREISQKEMAAAIGISECSLNLKLQGKREFTISEISKISKSLDILGDIENYFFC